MTDDSENRPPIEEGSDPDSNEDDQSGFRPTPEQKQALNLDRNIAITAGAGTGKTTTLTTRYLRILECNSSITPENIATITFTNDAANEMQERIRSEVDKRLTETADSGEYDYDRWRQIKDDLENGYIHTIHGFCARLLREYVVQAPVQPEFDTLDEADTTVLMQETVRETIQNLCEIDPDVKLLSRLWNRRALEAVLVGLLQRRPESTEWADRWHDATVNEYIDYIWATFHPIDETAARTVLTDPEVQDALQKLVELYNAGLDVDPDDNGMEFLIEVGTLVHETGILEGTATGQDCQRLIDDLCDRLTTGSGSVYSQRWRVIGSQSNWSNHETEHNQFDDTVDALIAGLDPESQDFIGGLDAEANSSHYVLALARLYQTVLDAYDETKTDQNSLDYHDQIERTIRFLRDADNVREHVRSRFEYVMVDEMQDTDPLQWELVRLLTTTDPDTLDAQNVFLVGDEKQSIFRFRGADVTTFGTARKELSSANSDDDGDATEQLSGNFRTLTETREFLNAVFDRVFEPLEDEYRSYEAQPQQLSDERRKGREVTGEIEYLLVPDDDIDALHGDGYLETTPRFSGAGEREAYALAARLTTLLDDPPKIYDKDEERIRKAKPENITILLRARTRLKAYERALDEYAIPYTVVSGSGFWDTPEITTLVNLLRVIENPTDDIALYGVLRSPLFGYTDETLARLAADDTSLWAALQDTDGPLATTYNLLEEWRRLAAVRKPASAETTVSWGSLLSRIIDDTGYIASTSADERPRQAAVNINKFREQLRAWEEAGVKTVSGLLTHIDHRKQIETHADEATIPEDADGVQIRTIHSAKGLEFPIVVVPEAGTEFNFQADVDEDGKVYLDQIETDKTGDREPVLGIKAPSGDDPYEQVNTLARTVLRDQLEMQERAEYKRLLYVAATRARDHFILSGIHPIDTDTYRLNLSSPNEASNARYWRDWLQPILLEDDEGDASDVLEGLAENDQHTAAIDGNEYTVRVPQPPTLSWDDSTTTRHEYPEIDIPEPTVPEKPVTITATNFAKALYSDAEAVYTDELEEDAAEVDTDGLAANHLGTIVHTLCERQPNRDRWRQDAEQLAAAIGEPVSDQDLDRIERYTERCIRFREQLVDERGPTTVHEELGVVARLEGGQILGDIDLLLVTPNHYHIVDYKTNDTARRSVNDLAEKYWPQLESYAAAVHQNDSSRKVYLTLYFADVDTPRTNSLDPMSLDILQEDLDTNLKEMTGKVTKSPEDIRSSF